MEGGALPVGLAARTRAAGAVTNATNRAVGMIAHGLFLEF